MSIDPKLKEELETEVKRIGGLISEAKQDGWLFVLTLTTPGGYTTYVSNVSEANIGMILEQTLNGLKNN